jgi:hypothetical protein
MPQKTGLYWEPLDARARELLGTLVAALKAGDPLAPISVFVPSTYAGLHLPLEQAREGAPTHRSALQIVGLVRPIPGAEKPSVLL